MKRVLKKAIAFVSAIAVAASMAVSASAASASTRIVKNSGYKQVFSTNEGIFFMNFTEKDLENSEKSKTVLCVTPDGKKTKVKIETKDHVTGFGLINTRSVYSDFLAPGYIDYSFYSDGATHYSSSDDEHELIFSSGKTVYVSAEDEFSYIEYGEYAMDCGQYIVIIDSINGKYSEKYRTANYNIYDEKGKKLLSIPYSSLKGADGSYIKLAAFDKETKTAAFVGMYDPEARKSQIWLVRNNKTVGKISASDYGIKFVKNSNGKTALKTYSNLDTYEEVYYSAENAKKISNFSKAEREESSNYSVKLKGKNWSVVNKAGKVLYSISAKKVAGYHIYYNSVAIITKSGSKYGLIMVK